MTDFSKIREAFRALAETNAAFPDIETHLRNAARSVDIAQYVAPSRSLLGPESLQSIQRIEQRVNGLPNQAGITQQQLQNGVSQGVQQAITNLPSPPTTTQIRAEIDQAITNMPQPPTIAQFSSQVNQALTTLPVPPTTTQIRREVDQALNNLPAPPTATQVRAEVDASVAQLPQPLTQSQIEDATRYCHNLSE
jgi:hypothetical protein